LTIPVIFNPHAGKKRALRRLRTLQAQLPGELKLWPTSHAGHAEQLALEAAQQGHELIVAAGGDGTVHETANGLLRSGRADVSLAILPLGSANDYFYSVQKETPVHDHGAGLRVDVGLAREPGGKDRYFLCCLGLGFNGMVTREARKIRGLQGIPLYGLATLRALWYHFAHPRLTVTLDEGPAITAPTLMLSLMIGNREGGFLLGPRASLTDGLFDVVLAKQLTRLQVLGLLPRLALSGTPESYPEVVQGRCRRVRLLSDEALIIHLDGEFFCVPEDGVREMDIELLPGRLRVFCQLPAAIPPLTKS
jgi:diacylglycerol kinase family enzyme